MQQKTKRAIEYIKTHLGDVSVEWDQTRRVFLVKSTGGTEMASFPDRSALVRWAVQVELKKGWVDPNA